jgi:hydrogenase maturation factor
MRILSVREDSALCQDADGAKHEVAVELVQPVSTGDEILVHAGVAIR